MCANTISKLFFINGFLLLCLNTEIFDLNTATHLNLYKSNTDSF